MENRLARLLDYQKFSPNSKLDEIIADVESRHSLDNNLMSDEDLGMLSAAGISISDEDWKKIEGYEERFFK